MRDDWAARKVENVAERRLHVHFHDHVRVCLFHQNQDLVNVNVQGMDHERDHCGYSDSDTE